jgi:urease accessory protein
MVITKLAGHGAPHAKDVATVKVEWFECAKKRLYKTASNGEEIGIALDAPLHDGDILYDDGTKAIVVRVPDCRLIRVPVHTMQEMGRVCFELGNRHLPIQIAEEAVCVPYDEPTFLYLQKLGFAAEDVTGAFTHYTACKAHDHAH